MLPYEVSLFKHSREKKRITCLYKGFNEDGTHHLIQDKGTQIMELYEPDTVQPFKYYFSREATNKYGEKFVYHVFIDEYGIKHSFYGELTLQQRKKGTETLFYIKGINQKSKTLNLAIYDPSIKHFWKRRYDAYKSKDERNGETKETLEQPRENQKCDVDLVFFSDSTFSLVEHGKMNDNKEYILVIHMPTSEFKGSLLLLTTNYIIKTVPMAEILRMPIGKRKASELDVFKIWNYFIAPDDSIAGIIANTNNGRFIYMMHVKPNGEVYALPADLNLKEISYCQPFLLPGKSNTLNIDSLIGKTTKVNEIDIKIIEDLHSYGVNL